MSSAESRVAQEVESSLKQLTSVFRAEEQRLKQVQTDLDKQAADLARRAELLEEEKLRMTAVGIADNDVIELNVGGQQFAMKRGTLTQVEGSVLSAMFSGRWEQSLDHDSQGRIFLDLDPYCFEKIITYLRSRSRDTALGLDTPEPVIESSKQHIFTQLIDYLGLTSVINSTSAALPEPVHEPFFPASQHFQVVNAVIDGAWSKTAVCRNHRGQVLVGLALTSGQVHFRKIKLHDLRAEFAGISGCEPLTGFREQSSSQSLLYGWQPGFSRPMWAHGHETQQPVDGFVTHLRGTLLFKVDLVIGELACISVGGAGEGSVLHAHARMEIPKVFAQSMHVRLDVQQCFDFQLHPGYLTPYVTSIHSMPISEAEKLLFDRNDMSAE